MTAAGDPLSHPGVRVDAARLLALKRFAAPYAAAGAAAGLPGPVVGRRRGEGHDLRELRPYVEGDDLRHIAAMATARTGTEQVRAFHEDEDRATVLIADLRRPMLWGTRGRLRSVAAAEALAVEGWRAIAAGGSVGLVAIGEDGIRWEKPRPRDRAFARVAGRLAEAHDAALRAEDAGLRLDEALEKAARLAPRGATFVLATAFDRPGEHAEAALARLARRGNLVVLYMRDAMERTPPRGALAYFNDGDSAWGMFRAGGAGRFAEAAAGFGAEFRPIEVEREIGGDDGGR